MTLRLIETNKRLVNFMLHPLDNKFFNEYEKYEHLLEKKVFLYSDRKPLNPKELSWAGKTYKLADPVTVSIPGKVTQPTKAIYRFTITYEGEQLFKEETDGFLFIYQKSTGVTSRSELGTAEGVSQIDFWVYPMRRI